MTVRRTRIDPTETSTEALSVRLSANTGRALAYLLDGDERSKSDVVQAAIVAAAQAKRDETLRRDSARLMGDPAEVARMKSMAADMEAIGVDLDGLEAAEIHPEVIEANYYGEGKDKPVAKKGDKAKRVNA